MKKTLLAFLVILLVVVACGRTKREKVRNGRTKIDITENYYQYKFIARFADEKTDRVRGFLRQKLASPSLLDQTRFNDNVALRSGTNIKLRLRPGYLEMRLKQEDRTESEMDEVRDMGESLKKIITKE